MQEWPYDIGHLSRDDIMRVIKCETWQRFRLSLKGTTTEFKLEELVNWYSSNHHWVPEKGCTKADCMMQVDNYLNALLRGGQLVRRGNKVVVQR